jgi:glycine cleavage system H protein
MEVAMSIVLALITATVLIVVGMLRSKKTRAPAPAVLIQRFVHPGHTWARTTEDGYVVVGVDDFAQSVVGEVNSIMLPRLLKRVRQGKVALHLHHGERNLPMVSPVSGWVVEKNAEVLRNPSLVNSAPFGEGWLFKVKPYNLGLELKNLLGGKLSRQWQDATRARLAQFFSGTPVFAYQDGGVMISNLCERCSELEWNGVRKAFFLNDEQPAEIQQ